MPDTQQFEQQILADVAVSPDEPALEAVFCSSDQLAPGQEAMQLLDVDFPAEALKAKRLKEIRLELVFLPLSYREETVHFNVSIGGQ